MADPEKTPSTGENETLRLETGSYILRPLIKDVALSAGDSDENVKITCVEFWNENLYIGTSAGEILHHVQIPPDPSDPSGQPVFILASRLQPPVHQQTGAGIQQILLIPKTNKACILSNNTITFYMLPELSPTYTHLDPLTCGWVGGVDLDLDPEDGGQNGIVVMMCLRNKIRLVKVAEEKPLKIRDIEFGGCLATVRRGDFACVADARTYALLDIVHQRKIPLFSISSADEQPAENAGTGTLQDEVWPITPGEISRSSSTVGNAASRLSVQERGHSRSTSLGVFKTDQHAQDIPRPSSGLRHGFDAPPTLNRGHSPRASLSVERRGSEGANTLLSKPLPPPPLEPTSGQTSRQHSPSKAFTKLKPLITSPNSSEFLLVMGTAPAEPGVGMFVNLDGEVVRGTIEFASYPDELVVDGKGIDLSSSPAVGEVQEEGYVLALVRRTINGSTTHDVEIQRWDIDPGEGASSKEWLGISSHIPGLTDTASLSTRTLGLRPTVTKSEISLPEITEKLTMKAIQLLQSAPQSESESQSKREKEEQDFVSRICKADARITLWIGDEVYWMVRNPMILRLDARLQLAQATSSERSGRKQPQRELIETLLNDIRGLKSQTELDFFTLAYIRQKAAILLFMDLILKTTSGIIASAHDKRATEEALTESELDPRIILTFLPTIRDELLQGPNGIWVQGGLKNLLDQFVTRIDIAKMPTDPAGCYGDNLLHLIKRYLLFWRRKKGNPSVTDGNFVFPTVDAALLHILLILDSNTFPGPAAAGSVRAELNSVIDSGVENFDRAVTLLEQFKRLYILSRLYQSKKLSAKVLETWRRIISGTEDLGGEFIDGEQELRIYLTKLRNRQLVEEYGTWLANRNPKLGVQVFADDNSRTTWAPQDALAVLREKAPTAVKEYLEHLVFGKKQPKHINELIAYYLDIVLNELERSEESRSILAATYETYRALRPPKPTYRIFIADNAINADWWHSRLRLLQLLGGNQGAASSYDVGTILDRLEPFEKELVPEMVILNGRQGRHEEAIRLLTHGLGDFDMAIAYCLRGGSSIFGSTADGATRDIIPTREEQSQLFGHLLQEFLRIEDISDRIERTGELLERFGGWFDMAYVLAILPDTWSIEIFSGFLISALRRLVRERSESTIAKALSGAENLKVNEEFIDKVEEVGPVVENVV
ncbi:hypothetical protein EJ08DRAFT_678423 [Tothia fuscella]|uniref:CNH domain-containing protein n=1 Tax=Tothia fuscella TaxID=1048955 RepID=A0A9P4NTF9_9PEZI|nr:hypothetical protein EJ08DRAFT_678423 [Tothia fuscella]